MTTANRAGLVSCFDQIVNPAHQKFVPFYGVWKHPTGSVSMVFWVNWNVRSGSPLPARALHLCSSLGWETKGLRASGCRQPLDRQNNMADSFRASLELSRPARPELAVSGEAGLQKPKVSQARGPRAKKRGLGYRWTSRKSHHLFACTYNRGGARRHSDSFDRYVHAGIYDVVCVCVHTW